MSVKRWPANDEPSSFYTILYPLRRAFDFGATWERKNADQDVPWTGLGIGKDLLVSDFDADEKLKAERIRYGAEEQDRDFVSTILGLAIQLGIEQGRRCERKRLKMDIDTMRIGLDIASRSLQRCFPKPKRRRASSTAEGGQG